jgi:hypothetical protein
LKNIFFDEKMVSKIDILKKKKKSVSFWHRKLTLSVQFWPFLTVPHYLHQFTKYNIFFETHSFFDRIKRILDPPGLRSGRKNQAAVNIYVHIFLRTVNKKSILIKYNANIVFLGVQTMGQQMMGPQMMGPQLSETELRWPLRLHPSWQKTWHAKIAKKTW